MYLTKVEIVKRELNEEMIVTEKVRLTAFDKEGMPFMKINLEDLENKYVIVSTFNWHDDTYLLVADK